MAESTFGTPTFAKAASYAKATAARRIGAHFRFIYFGGSGYTP